MYQKAHEAGWFYHAPGKRRDNVEPVGYPPASQIPELGDHSTLPIEKPRQIYFKDTDSQYTRLNKLGGRKDLLTIRPNPENKGPAVCYPRNEWYYLEDNAREAERKREKTEPFQFMLPEYMVHEQTTVEYNPRCRRPAPWAVDNQEKLSAEGHYNTDKTAKIPEIRPPGYGVRSGKLVPSGRKLPKGKPKDLATQQGSKARLRYKSMPHETDEPTDMNKLLSHTYDREWHQRHLQWQKEQAKGGGGRSQGIDSDGKQRSDQENMQTSEPDCQYRRTLEPPPYWHSNLQESTNLNRMHRPPYPEITKPPPDPSNAQPSPNANDAQPFDNCYRPPPPLDRKNSSSNPISGHMTPNPNNSAVSLAESGGRSREGERGGAGVTQPVQRASPNKEPQANKEPFKLSKFKNVPARINSHQAPEILAAVGN